MIPGPANVLSCPFCGGTKEVMSLVSGNTCGATVWSDTRRHYPMLPEVSPIQECPHCHKYYFIEQAKREYSKDPDSEISSFMQLGMLNLEQLTEARKQMESLSLTKMQRWILNHQLFMAYNDYIRPDSGKKENAPTPEQTELQRVVINELLDGIDQSEDYELFHAELLRETGRFEEAKSVLAKHKAKDDEWVVEAMLRYIHRGNKTPFLLVKDGDIVK